MNVTVNGQARALPAHTTVAGLLARIGPGLDRRGTAVAVNGEIVPRTAWEGVTLEEGDRVEVLGAMQGG